MTTSPQDENAFKAGAHCPDLTVEEQLAAERDKTRQLEAECQRLAALAEGRFKDIRLLEAGPRDGSGFGFDYTGGPISYIAEYLAQMLGYRDGEPSNYAEIEVSHTEFGTLTLTLQRRSGLTPHQKAQAAVERAHELALDLAAAKTRIAELEGLKVVIEGAPIALEQARYMMRDYAAKGGAPGRMPEILAGIADALRDWEQACA